MTVFNPSARQLSDIAEYAKALATVEDALNKIDPDDLGEGFRAVLTERIPVYTDARGTKEILGWLVPSDFTWEFTQQKENV